MTNPINLNNSDVQLQYNPPVDRVIRWYEKQGDRVVGEMKLQNVSLSELQNLI